MYIKIGFDRVFGKEVEFKYRVYKDSTITEIRGTHPRSLPPSTKTTHEKVFSPGTGLLIGERWLPDGETEWDEEIGEYGTRLSGPYPIWEQTGTTHVFLVVKNGRENPFYVDPETTTIYGMPVLKYLGRE